MTAIKIPDEGYIYDVILLMCGLPDMTIDCIDHIRTAMADESYRIIFVDNASEASEAAKVTRFMTKNRIPCVTFHNSANLGFVKGVNLGLARSTAPYVVLQNNDAFVFPQTYARMRRTCAKTGCGAIGTISTTGWQDIKSLKRVWSDLRGINAQLEPAQIAEQCRMRLDQMVHIVDGTNAMLAFFCTMFRREVIREIGYLSERYEIGLGDDDDYCVRLRRAGYKLALALDVFVQHDRRTTWKTLYRQEEIAEAQKHAIGLLKKTHPDMIR